MGALASRRFLDGGAGVGVGPPAGHAVASNGADQGGGAPRSDRPRVLRGVGQVHLVEGDVGVQCASGFSANAGDGAFKGQGGCAGSQRWGMHCGGHQTHPEGPHTGNAHLSRGGRRTRRRRRTRKCSLEKDVAGDARGSAVGGREGVGPRRPVRVSGA